MCAVNGSGVCLLRFGLVCLLYSPSPLALGLLICCCEWMVVCLFFYGLGQIMKTWRLTEKISWSLSWAGPFFPSLPFPSFLFTCPPSPFPNMLSPSIHPSAYLAATYLEYHTYLPRAQLTHHLSPPSPPPPLLDDSEQFQSLINRPTTQQ